MRSNIHLLLHFLVPLIIAAVFYGRKWKGIYIVLVGTMLVDLDHLLASPIYDANRCSIGFHPLHSYYAIPIYFLLLIWRKLRLVALGLLIHMGLDGLDCHLMV